MTASSSGCYQIFYFLKHFYNQSESGYLKGLFIIYRQLSLEKFFYDTKAHSFRYCDRVDAEIQRNLGMKILNSPAPRGVSVPFLRYVLRLAKNPLLSECAPPNLIEMLGFASSILPQQRLRKGSNWTCMMFVICYLRQIFLEPSKNKLTMLYCPPRLS